VPARPATRTLLTGQDGTDGLVRRTVLPGGLRVLTEAVPGVRSVTFGIWVGVGSRDESPALAGASHYLEHLLFKGTARRDALEIASALDGVGGEANAFTEKEYTCFYARVLDADLPLAVDVTCDMVTSSLVRAADVDSERGVVLEEIAMHDDDPADVVHDEFAAALFGPTHPLGRPILGTAGSLEAMTRAAVHGYYRRRYTIPGMVVAAAGALDHATVVRLVREAFDRAGALGDPGVEPAAPRAEAPSRRTPVPSRLSVVERRTEQANVVSSRLFQEIRERRGLAYSVYSFSSSYADDGLYGVYAGCTPKRVPQVLALIREQLGAVADAGITTAELARGQGQLRGSLVLGLEDTGDRMNRLGKSELAYRELLGVDELLRRIGAVTLDDVRDVARHVLTGPLALAAVGRFPDTGALQAAVA
jgi:predicted Zn-dependent peptidase